MWIALPIESATNPDHNRESRTGRWIEGFFDRRDSAVSGRSHDRVCRGTDRDGDDRRRQRHRHGQHEGGRAGRDGQPVGAVVDDAANRPHRRGGRLPLFGRADRRPHAHLRRSPVSGRLSAKAFTSALGFTATVNVEMSPGTITRQRHRQRLARGRRLVDRRHDPFRRREARHAARLARHLCGPGQHAGRRACRRWTSAAMARSPCRTTPPTACAPTTA